MRSPVFDINPIVHERSAAVAQIVADIEHGRNLTRYLSRRVEIGFDLPRARSTKNLYKRGHLDLLLDDWGIHHLHVSTTTDPDGFVERADPIIFAIFKPERAYFIDAGTHRDFARGQLIRIIIETWPDDGLAFELKGILGGARSYTDEERTKLRAAGLSVLSVQINSRCFAPAGGFSTAGISDKASINSERIMRTLTLFEEQIRADPTPIIETMRHYGGHPTDAPEFEFSFFQEGFGVIETRSGVAIGLGS